MLILNTAVMLCYRRMINYVLIIFTHTHAHAHMQRLHVSPVLKDAAVKDMVWDSKGTRVFFGDALGRVAVTHIPKVCFKHMHFFTHYSSYKQECL